MSTILVIAEIQDGQLKSFNHEMFTVAAKLAKETSQPASALILGSDPQSFSEIPAKFGVENALLIEDAALENFSPDVYAAAIADVVRQKNAGIILMGATYTGKDLMARAAQILETGLAQDCVNYRVEGDKIHFTRPMYAGKVLAEVTVSAEPVMATIRPKSFKAEEAPVNANVEKLQVSLPDPLAVVEEVQTSASGKLDVTEADIIVSGGRGMKGPENWNILEDLAKVLGAATGCSRPVSDEEWRPHDEHIGQTGKTVSPTMYIACGISGAIQHLAGMSSSKYIVAINKDPEAPIFSVADYGIVGDVFEVLPAMTEEIKKIKGEE